MRISPTKKHEHGEASSGYKNLPQLLILLRNPGNKNLINIAPNPNKQPHNKLNKVVTNFLNFLINEIRQYGHDFLQDIQLGFEILGTVLISTDYLGLDLLGVGACEDAHT